ncbi:hypothetical protein Emed_004040 [Eimeria media]
MGFKHPLVLLQLVALGTVLYQLSGAVGSHASTGKEGLVQSQELPQSSENEKLGPEIDQAAHEEGVVRQFANTPVDDARMTQEQTKVEGIRQFMHATDEEASVKRELGGAASQGQTRLGSLWNEKLLRKEFKKVSEAIDQLQSPSSRAELYERLEQKLNQARFEGAISPDEEFVDTDANGADDACNDCAYNDTPRPSRRPGRGVQNSEQEEGYNTAEISRPTRPTEEEELIEEPSSEGEGERKPHSSRRPRFRRRTAAESSGQSVDEYDEGEEDEQLAQEGEEGGVDLAQVNEAETDEGSIDDQTPNTTEAEDRVWHTESSLNEEDVLEQNEPEATEIDESGETQNVDASYEGVHGTDQVGESEVVSEELLDHETLEHRDEALPEETINQESQEMNQTSESGVNADEQNHEKTHAAEQVGEEGEPQDEGQLNQEFHEDNQITPNEVGNEEKSDEIEKPHEVEQGDQREEGESDEQKSEEASNEEGEVNNTPRQSFRQTRQRKPVIPTRNNLQEESYSPTLTEGEPIRYAAETQGGVPRQTQRATTVRRRQESESRAESGGVNETQRRGPIRRQVGGSNSEETVRHGVPQGGEDNTKEVLSYALREAEKLEQMANKMKHLYDYVVEQERLTRTGSTVVSSRPSPKPASREALEKMIEKDIDNLLDSFRTLLNYAKDVQHTEEIQERRWEAPSPVQTSTTKPQREGNRMQVNEAESFTPQQVRPSSQRVERARSASGQDRAIPQGRSSSAVSRSSNAPTGRRIPTSSSSHNARQSEDASDLTYKILDNYGNSNITVRTLQDINNTLDAFISTESNTLGEELEKGMQTQEGDHGETEESSATSDIEVLKDHEEHLESINAAPARALSAVSDDVAPDSSFSANTDEAPAVAGMNMKSDVQDMSRDNTQSGTGDGKQEVEENQKNTTTVFDPHSEEKGGSSEPSNETNTTSSFEGVDKQPTDAEALGDDAINDSQQNLEALGVHAEDNNASSAVRALAGLRKRTRFNQSSEEEASALPVFAVTPFETSSSRPPPAGPPERWAGAYTIRLSPRVSGMTRSSDGSDYPNTPYRTYRSYSNPFSSPYSTHSFHEDYGKRFSNIYYHDKFPHNAISWKEFVRRREEKKALEKRKQEEANEPKLGVIETAIPKEVGILKSVNSRRSNLRPGTPPTQVYRQYTPMRPAQPAGSPSLSNTNRTRVSFTPYSSIAAAQGVTAF